MTQTLDKPQAAIERSEGQRVTYQALRGLAVPDAERRIEPFLTWLHDLSAEKRKIAAGDFCACELWIWARHFPEEVPLVNGEYAWIAMTAP